MVTISYKKISLHVAAIGIGILGSIYIPSDNKDFIGWVIGSFTAFGGILLAVMALAGHSLTLLQFEDWKSLQNFRNTYKAQIFFSAFVSFLLILTVILFLGQTILSLVYLKNIVGFFVGVCIVYILTLPFTFSCMYIDYYDFIIKKRKK